jgi:hypothetical protein
MLSIPQKSIGTMHRSVHEHLMREILKVPYQETQVEWHSQFLKVYCDVVWYKFWSWWDIKHNPIEKSV